MFHGVSSTASSGVLQAHDRQRRHTAGIDTGRHKAWTGNGTELAAPCQVARKRRCVRAIRSARPSSGTRPAGWYCTGPSRAPVAHCPRTFGPRPVLRGTGSPSARGNCGPLRRRSRAPPSFSRHSRAQAPLSVGPLLPHFAQTRAAWADSSSRSGRIWLRCTAHAAHPR